MASGIRVHTATAEAPTPLGKIRVFTATVEAPQQVGAVRVHTATVEAPRNAAIQVHTAALEVPAFASIPRYVTIDGIRRVVSYRRLNGLTATRTTP